MPDITNKTDLDALTLLGKPAQAGKTLETFPNHHPGRDYRVTLITKEFTCLCPMTGQPDFARLSVTYIPDQLIVESKSLKLYLASFRNEGAFHEHVTNAILDDLVKTLAPRWCKVTAEFAGRGGIAITVDAEHGKILPAVHQPAPAPAPQREPPRTAYERKRPDEASYKQSPARYSTDGRRNAEGDKGRMERKEFRPEKRWPSKEGTPPEREPRRSERKTTKALGETRTWRKRT